MKYIKVVLLPPAKTDDQVINRMKRYGGFYDMRLVCDGKNVGFEKLIKWIESGIKIIVGNPKNKLVIKCGLYYYDRWDGIIPVVKKSNHHRFVEGTRFDYGFMCVSLEDGYTIYYN